MRINPNELHINDPEYRVLPEFVCWSSLTESQVLRRVIRYCGHEKDYEVSMGDERVWPDHLILRHGRP